MENCITPYFEQLIQNLMANANREDAIGSGVDLMNSSYTAITEIVQESCPNSKGLVQQLVIPICNLI